MSEPYFPFDMPIMEMSVDGGKTWEAGSTCCGPGMLMRIVRKDGKVLWEGVGKTVKEKCAGCNGTGIQDRCLFEEKPNGN